MFVPRHVHAFFFPETKIMGLCINKVRSWELKFPVTTFLSKFHRLRVLLLTGFISLVQFSCSVMSGSLRPHGLQHTRLPCPSPTPGACSNSRPLSQMPSSHLILCRPLLPPSLFPSIRVISNESALRICWPKYWSFSLCEHLTLVWCLCCQ